MAIRLIRLSTGDDGQSHFDVGEIEWDRFEALNAMSCSTSASRRPKRGSASIGTMPRVANT
jgi:hypothetical protein